MRILFVDQFSEMGGAQRVLIDTVDAAQERGWCTHVALPPGGALMDHLRGRKLDVSEIPCGPYRPGKKSVPDIVRFAFDLRRQVQALDALMARTHFDLVYVNGPRVLPGASLANGNRAPMLFHVHYPIHQSSAARLTGWSLGRAEATVVACSQAAVDSIRKYTRSKKLNVIENGVREICFGQHRFGERGWRIGLVGRISRQKGQLDFVKAASRIAAEWPSARFVICGAPLFGEDDYSNLVRGAARGLPVDFLGWREDVAAVLEDLDFLVMPSQDEGMPRALLEAFSAGVPVVAFPTGGIPEVVVDGATGFLTKGTSAEALAARIREVIASGPDVLRRVSANARTAWERFYTLARYQERITAVMENLVSASPAERETRMLPARR